MVTTGLRCFEPVQTFSMANCSDDVSCTSRDLVVYMPATRRAVDKVGYLARLECSIVGFLSRLSIVGLDIGACDAQSGRNSPTLFTWTVGNVALQSLTQYSSYHRLPQKSAVGQCVWRRLSMTYAWTIVHLGTLIFPVWTSPCMYIMKAESTLLYFAAVVPVWDSSGLLWLNWMDCRPALVHPA